MMAANSKSTLANPSCGDAEQRACREAFDKAGYWPNEVMWKAWQQAWTASRAFVPPPPSSELPIPDNERWLHEPENKANLERAMAVATKPSSDALAVSELAAVKEALDAAGAYVGGSLASRVQSLDTERRRLIDEARAAVQNDRAARWCTVSYQHQPHDGCDGTPAPQSERPAMSSDLPEGLRPCGCLVNEQGNIVGICAAHSANGGTAKVIDALNILHRNDCSGAYHPDEKQHYKNIIANLRGMVSEAMSALGNSTALRADGGSMVPVCTYPKCKCGGPHQLVEECPMLAAAPSTGDSHGVGK